MGRKKADIVVSSWKGIVTLRSKPAKVKQTPNTVQTGHLFGMASNRSGIIRKLLKPLLPEPANRVVMYRLQQAFYQWLRTGSLIDTKPVEDISFFKGLSLNPKNDVSQFMKFSPAVMRLPDGQLGLNFPAINLVQQIKTPDGTTAIKIYIGVAGLLVNNAPVQHGWKDCLTIQYTNGILPPKQIILPVAAGPGKLLIIMIALQFVAQAGVQQVADPLPWKPAGIIGSFYN